MSLSTLTRRAEAAYIPAGLAPFSLHDGIDPFDGDESTDLPVLTSERRLQRLAIVPADTGARFAREAIPCDPMAWMLAPRALFDGQRPIDACQKVGGFIRATMLHSLSLGLDADPDDMDMLMDGELPGEAAGFGEFDPSTSRREPSGPKARLFTCLVDGSVGGGGARLQAFCAMTANSPDTVRRRLRSRYGEALADFATIREGFERGEPLAQRLLSVPLIEMLVTLSADPSGELGLGLDVHVEQRLSL